MWIWFHLTDQKKGKFCIGNRMVSSALWNKFARAGFQKVQNCTSPQGECNLKFLKTCECKFIPKVHENTMWFLVNNIDAKISNQDSLFTNTRHLEAKQHLKFSANLVAMAIAKIWLASLNFFCFFNQSLRSVSGFAQGVSAFCTGCFREMHRLSTNQKWEIFASILLDLWSLFSIFYFA